MYLCRSVVCAHTVTAVCKFTRTLGLKVVKCNKTLINTTRITSDSTYMELSLINVSINQTDSCNVCDEKYFLFMLPQNQF